MNNKRYVNIDDILDLFGIEDEDLYATGTIEDALYDGTLKVYKLPPTEQRGRWTNHSDEWDGGYYECSVCGEAYSFIEGTPKENNYRYCPNCGARMEVE